MNWTHRAVQAAALTITAGVLAGAAGVKSDAAPRAGVSGLFALNTKNENIKENVSKSSCSARSGVSLLLGGNVAESDTSSDTVSAVAASSDSQSTGDTSVDETAQAEQAEENQAANDSATDAQSIANIGIANVTEGSFVYVRTQPDTNSDYAGKLYSKGCATVTGESGDFYQITSGDVSGYVSKQYLTVGDQAAIDAASRKTATVTAVTLYVRSQPTTESSVLTMVPETDDLTVTDDSTKDSGWVQVDSEAGTGYVSTQYVTLSTQYSYAESKASEQQRIAQEQAEREAAQKAAEKAKAEKAAKEKAAKAKSSSSSSKSSSSSTKTYAAAGSGSGSSVVSYASQFVGNRYVYGGTSLTNGTDCSGFVMGVYRAFGVSLPHSSAAMRSVGYGVSTSEMQAGDIVCYSGHVGIYAGNGTIVNASNPRSGITYTNVNYRHILAVRRIF